MSGNNRNVVWTLEQDEILIDFVKNHESLYNVKCKDYRKTQMKLNLWREIANIIEDKTDTECSKRWAYVRDYYVRRKEKPGTGAPGEAAAKRAEQLSFLDNYSSIKRSTMTNIVNSEENPQDADVIEENFNEDLENSTQGEFGSQSEMPSKEVNTVVNDRDINREKSKPPKRQKHLSNSEERMKLLKKIAEKRNNSEEQDENDLFFASMAKMVKKLPEREQVDLRIQICNMVGNAQLRCIQQQDYNDRSRPISADSAVSGNFNAYQNESSAFSSGTPPHTLSEQYTSTLTIPG